MTDKGVEQKPSETAMFAALRRAIANKEYQNEVFGPDDLAVIFLPPHFRFFLKFQKIQANTKDNLESVLPGLNAYMIARTAYFDELFKRALKEGTPQIVLLGAGYDSRAYRFAELNHATKVFELDVSPTQERKKTCLKKAKVAIPQHVIFVPINFNQDSLIDVLEGAGYQRGEKTLFIWEGVSYYLDPNSVDETLVVVGHSVNKESTIAFDYTVSITEDTQNEYGVQEFAQTMKEQHASEELLFSVDDGDLEAFLDQRNLEMVEHMDNEEIERKYLTDDDGELLGPITGHFRFVVASPKVQ